MEIHSLRVSVGEQELNELAKELPAGNSAVENLRVRLTPEGIVILGEYPALLMKMAFETLWQVSGVGSVVQARLASIKVSGVPAAMLRGVLLKTIRDMLAREPGVQVEGDTIQVDLSQHRAAQKIRLRINLTAVCCNMGKITIEAGSAII
jgi:hypothetical protein